jgi:hypothetical protein
MGQRCRVHNASRHAPRSSPTQAVEQLERQCIVSDYGIITRFVVHTARTPAAAMRVVQAAEEAIPLLYRAMMDRWTHNAMDHATLRPNPP